MYVARIWTEETNPPKTCLECSNNFYRVDPIKYRWISHDQWKNRKFCSSICRRLYFQERAKLCLMCQEPLEGADRGPSSKICAPCQARFPRNIPRRPCQPEVARKIVYLLLHDPAAARMWERAFRRNPLHVPQRTLKQWKRRP